MYDKRRMDMWYDSDSFKLGTSQAFKSVNSNMEPVSVSYVYLLNLFVLQFFVSVIESNNRSIN